METNTSRQEPEPQNQVEGGHQVGGDHMNSAEPRAEHTWLSRLVGEWSFEAEALGAPGQPPMKSEGTETVRSLGDLWFVAEGEGRMPDGTPIRTMMTLGYDPAKDRYVGTWIGSMMTHMWVYRGSVDESGRVLTLDTEGPAMPSTAETAGMSDVPDPPSGSTPDPASGTARYRDVIEFESDDRRLLRSLALTSAGEWQEFMVARYRRLG